MAAEASRTITRRSSKASVLPARSSCAFFFYQAGRIELDGNRLALMQTRAELGQSRPLCDLSNLCQQIIRQRHAGHGGTGLQSAMEGVGHVAKLNHLRHVINILSCESHVKMQVAAGVPLAHRGSKDGAASAVGLPRVGVNNNNDLNNEPPVACIRHTPSSI